MDEKKEELKTESLTDALISQSDIEKIEKEIMGKDKAKEEALRKDVEAKIRKEIETETKLKELETKNRQYEEMLKKYLDEKKIQEEQHVAELEKVKQEVGSSKAIHNVQSPFRRDANIPIDFDNLSPEQLKEIEEQSKRAFKEHLKDKGNFLGNLNDW